MLNFRKYNAEIPFTIENQEAIRIDYFTHYCSSRAVLFLQRLREEIFKICVIENEINSFTISIQFE